MRSPFTRTRFLRIVRVFGLVVIAAAVLLAPALAVMQQVQAAPADQGARGQSITGSMGITETTAQIMERQARLGPNSVQAVHPDVPEAALFDGKQTAGAALAQGPISGQTIPNGPNVAFTAGTSFNGPGSTTNFCGTPPDTMGAVGPTQFIIFVNCNIVSYNKATGAADGVLSTTPNTFFSSVRSSSVSDPHIRYDRLTQRWFLNIIDVTFPNNRVLLAVSNSATITAGTVWTLFFFQSANGSHTNCLADYPTPGIDANAIYIGVNQFCGSSIATASYAGSDGFVVQKSSVLGAGPIKVTAFQSMTDQYTPQGVDNSDPAATEGYFLGGSAGFWNKINLGRVSNPGSLSPTLATVTITTANQGQQPTQPHKGNTGGSNGMLDGSDNRPMAVMLRNGQLWTAMTVGVTSSGSTCTGVAGGSADRDALFWWQITNIATAQTPSIVQSGVVCDPGATNPLFYSYGTIAVNGQGHAALGYTFTGANTFTSTGVSARLASDAAGTLPTSFVTQAGADAYNPSFDSGASRGYRRWGDYSYTSVDPCDDMTIWTVQEFAQPANNYREHVTKLIAPPPAAVSSAGPSSISSGQSSVNVTITGISSGGSGFYDTPSNLSGEPCRKRIGATVTGGVSVNSVTYNNPTSLTLNVSTVSASAGLQTVTITNPDGQIASGAVLTIAGAARPDTVGIYRPSNGTFYLRNSNTQGFADISATFGGDPSDYPVTGDWNGDGIDTIGVYRRSTGTFYLRNSNTPGAPDVTPFVLGSPNDYPLSGHWTADMTGDGVGVYRNSNGVLYLKKQLTSGFADFNAILGIPGDFGVAGDWDGNGFDSPGVYRPSQVQFYLSNNSTPSGVTFGDITLIYGSAGDVPFVGDWVAQGHDGVGMFRPSNGFLYIRNALTTGFANNSFFYGVANDIPVAGKWIAGPLPPTILVPPKPPATAVPGPDSRNGLE